MNRSTNFVCQRIKIKTTKQKKKCSVSFNKWLAYLIGEALLLQVPDNFLLLPNVKIDVLCFHGKMRLSCFLPFTMQILNLKTTMGRSKNTLTVYIQLQLKYKIQLSACSRRKTVQAHKKSVFHYKVTVHLFLSIFLSKQERESGKDINFSLERNTLHNIFSSQNSHLS